MSGAADWRMLSVNAGRVQALACWLGSHHAGRASIEGAVDAFGLGTVFDAAIDGIIETEDSEAPLLRLTGAGRASARGA